MKNFDIFWEQKIIATTLLVKHTEIYSNTIMINIATTTTKTTKNKNKNIDNNHNNDPSSKRIIKKRK